MDILKFTIDKVEFADLFSGGTVEIRGSFSVIDSNGVEQPMLFQGWNDNMPTEATGPNGEDLGYNDMYVETEQEQGYVLFEYLPADSNSVPAKDATLFLNDADYDAMFKALDSAIGKRLADAYDAAEDAFQRVVMTDAR